MVRVLIAKSGVEREEEERGKVLIKGGGEEEGGVKGWGCERWSG